jgi:hypothetical protein
LLLELQSAQLIRKEGEKPPSWYAARSGLFSEEPHLVLQESFWHADSRSSTTRFLVIDAGTAAVSRYALSNEAYTTEELETALRVAGFDHVEHHTSMGSTDPDFPVVVARG